MNKTNNYAEATFKHQIPKLLHESPLNLRNIENEINIKTEIKKYF